MKKLLWSLAILGLLVAVVHFLVIPYCRRERDMPFEAIGELEMNITREEGPFGDYVWVNIVPYGQYDFPPEYLEEYCAIDQIEFDFTHYRYVACAGYAIVGMSYNYCDVWGRLSGHPTYHPRVEIVDEGRPSTLYIYRVPAEYSLRYDIHSHGFDDSRIVLLN